MNLDNYTNKSQQAVLRAQRLAEEFNHQEIEPIHLLYALLEESEGVVPAVVTRIAGGIQGLREELRKDLSERPKVYGGNIKVGLNRKTSDVLSAGERYAKGMQDEYVSTEHLLLGLIESPEERRLKNFGLTLDAVLEALKAICGSVLNLSELVSKNSWSWSSVGIVISARSSLMSSNFCLNRPRITVSPLSRPRANASREKISSRK